MGFDFNFPCPMQFVERFLRILNADKIPEVYDIAYGICKLQLIDPKFLNYKPSEIAASSVILAINMHQKEKNQFDFFKYTDGKPALNLNIWNQYVS